MRGFPDGDQAQAMLPEQPSSRSHIHCVQLYSQSIPLYTGVTLTWPTADAVVRHIIIRHNAELRVGVCLNCCTLMVVQRFALLSVTCLLWVRNSERRTSIVASKCRNEDVRKYRTTRFKKQMHRINLASKLQPTVTNPVALLWRS